MTDRGWGEARNLSVDSRVLTKDKLYKIVENMEIKSYNYVKTYRVIEAHYSYTLVGMLKE